MIPEITSQYRASLKMLTDVINKCPDTLWNDTSYENAYWRIVYHTLFYTALYLSESPSAFKPWAKHIANYNSLGMLTRDGKPVVIEQVYAKDELTEYAESIFEECEAAVPKFINNETSGFPWVPLNRFSLHLHNLRHIQHHTGQLTERLHQAGIKGIEWVGLG